MEAALNGPTGRIVLQDGALTIGRVPDNQLVVADAKASSHHAELRPEGQGYTITDLKSTNGTFVNEQPIQPHTPRLLQAGDVIRIGDTKFTYEVAGVNPLEATMYGGPARSEPPAYEPTVFARPPSPVQGIDEPQNVPPPPPGAPNYTQYQPQQQEGAYPYNPPPPPEYNPNAPGAVPAYPYQPAQAPQRKRSYRGLFIGLGILLVVLLLACGTLVFVVTRTAGASATLDSFCTALKNKDYKTVYQQFSTRSQLRTRLTQDQFVTVFSQTVDSHGGVSSCTVSDVNENGSNATGTLSYVFGDQSKETDGATLVKDDVGWRMMNLSTK